MQKEAELPVGLTNEGDLFVFVVRPGGSVIHYIGMGIGLPETAGEQRD